MPKPQSVRVAAIIPARMAASRFPGKPLLPFHGLPMVEHVRRRALLARVFSEVVVATCDQEIAEVIEGFDGRVIMTSPDHPAATDRVAEAMRHLDCTHVVNVQGDEILVLPEDLKRMVETIGGDHSSSAWNAVAPIERIEELADRSIVKCLVSATNRVLVCSRDFSRLSLRNSFEPVRIIVGILAYERAFLDRYGRMSRTPLETIEAIDQSRIIEHDAVLQGVPFKKGYPGVNEPREVPIIEEYLGTDPLQRDVLAEVLAV